MKTHYLKCWPEYYKLIEAGIKKFEIRKDDRGFNVNDIVVLYEYDPAKSEFTGNELMLRITYILRSAPEFGLINGYCILSLKFLQ